MSAVGVQKTSIAEEPRWLRGKCVVNGSARDCRILEVDPRGVYVESFVPAMTGSRARITFSLPNGHEVAAKGIVSRHEFARGFGIEFEGLTAADHDEITRMIG